MNRHRRTFLFTATAAVLASSVAPKTYGQTPAKALIPHSSWDCGMAEGIPNPESGALLFEAQMKLDRLASIGKTPYGSRRVAVGMEGKVTGPKLSVTIMTGALDLELTLANGAVEVEDILVFKTDDGKYIYSRSAGVGADAKDVRVAMDFEAPNGSAAKWLNTGKYVARRILDENAKILTLRVYDVSNVAIKSDAANAIRIAKPNGVPAQPWNYRQRDAAEKPGKELIVESVGLSPSQRVGASKRGNRNIIPITGGDLSGRITGKVLSGGADYQNLSGPPAIDARYLWQATDGEIILVRNTTSAAGGLVPAFEARVDGPYAYLNTGLFLSSNPGMANGGVKITMYESTK
ncbi:MAG TPA: DUF3237 family protein [Bryobacteraceae bacterium]|jgi:hypothetical protein